MATKLRDVLANIGVGKVTGSASPQTVASSFRSGDVQQQCGEVISRLKKVINTIDEVTSQVVLEALTPTYELSQVYVPVDTGELKASGFLQKYGTRGQKGVSTVAIGYARNGTPDYAVLVHEMLDMHHRAPTSAKFLLRALLEDEDNIGQRIIDGMRLDK